MNSEPIRVLHVLGRLNMGGAETRIMDLYRHIDRNKVQFDFLVHYRRTDADRAAGIGTDSEALYRVRTKEDFDEEALLLGAHIYVLPRFTGTNYAEYRKACRTFFREHHEWAVIEGHMTSMASVYLPIAKEEAAKAASAQREPAAKAASVQWEPVSEAAAASGEGTPGPEAGAGIFVPVTIAHARSAGVDAGIRGVATRLFRRSLPKRCDIMMSCSGPASVSVFGEQAARSGRIMLVPNALDLEAFRYDAALRAQVRAEYGISDDTLVIGHVGRFDPVKNQAFLARVGAEWMTGNGNAEENGADSESKPFGSPAASAEDGAPSAAETPGVRGTPEPRPEGLPGKILFLLVGKGDLQEPVREAFEKEGLGTNVIFTGLLPREKTAAMYQAFDVFTLPSRYEGLPGTVIEAQAAGLPCVIADTITEEVAVTELVRRLPLDDPAAWARAIAEAARGRSREEAAEEALRQLTEAGYEIRSAAKRMQEFYLGLTPVQPS